MGGREKNMWQETKRDITRKLQQGGEIETAKKASKGWRENSNRDGRKEKLSAHYITSREARYA